MNTCPNCGKMAGFHGSVLQGCMCQYSMQAPPQRTWVGLTNNDLQPIADEYRILFGSWVYDFARAIEAKLKEKNMPVFLGIRGGLAHDAGEKP